MSLGFLVNAVSHDLTHQAEYGTQFWKPSNCVGVWNDSVPQQILQNSNDHTRTVMNGSSNYRLAVGNTGHDAIIEGRAELVLDESDFVTLNTVWDHRLFNEVAHQVGRQGLRIKIQEQFEGDP